MQTRSDAQKILDALELRLAFCRAHNFDKYVPGLVEAIKVIERDMLPQQVKIKSL